MARALLEAGARPDARDRSGDSLLVIAIHTHQPALLDALLAHGADPNAIDASGLSPLYWAEREERAAMVQRLLAAGARASEQQRSLRASGPYRTEDF
ncbi:MAG: hypothetical protein GTN84_07870 [Hydrogenophaga sp.]|nr:ankyrin repeat domain-containing protein [Hydrogenophaga sp.]NIM40971.1 hypothetical protein [Hydrogenophaga sp.]NIN26329.1 hypothetical protein [Hydrogenophaga sp.]NIN31204.1 hypothetical protein [Hydrogenophaga sp.]NIN55243.1 hypothetical protein [Hydrogenophaga sp.]NIO53627.1 hypothetical protein [Hydrogenophaga sp.]